MRRKQQNRQTCKYCYYTYMRKCNIHGQGEKWRENVPHHHCLQNLSAPWDGSVSLCGQVLAKGWQRPLYVSSVLWHSQLPFGHTENEGNDFLVTTFFFCCCWVEQLIVWWRQLCICHLTSSLTHRTLWASMKSFPSCCVSHWWMASTASFLY